MCSHAVTTAVAAATLLVCAAVAVPLDAQVSPLTPEERAHLEAELAHAEARIAALDELLQRTLEAEAQRAEEVKLRHVSGTVGPVELRGTPDLVDIGAEAVRTALDAFGDVLQGLGRLPPLRLEIYDPSQIRSADAEEMSEEGWKLLLVSHDRAGAQVRRNVRDHVIASLPAPVGPWSGGWGWDTGYDPAVGLRSIVRSTDTDGVRCLQTGDLEACSHFLFLDYDGSVASRRAALERLYPEEEVAAFLAATPESRAPGPGFERCLADAQRRGSPDARTTCLDDFAERPPLTFGLLPAHPAARASILAYALRRNPADGMRRMTSLPPGVSVGEQLAAIADMPLDRLLAAWRDDASLGQGPFADAGTNRPGPISLFWAGGLAMLALRSTRWRLG